MYWYMARRSGSVVSFMLHHGMGGRGLNVLMYATHASSVIAGTVSRRLEAYVVPQGPRHPSVPLPRSQSFSGTLPSLGA